MFREMAPVSGQAIMIGLDWGTTSLRAYRIGTGGAVLEQRAEAAGILQVPDGQFAAALRPRLGDWLSRERRTCPCWRPG